MSTWGAIVGDGFIDLGNSGMGYDTLAAAIEADVLPSLDLGEFGASAALDEVEFMPVIPDPRRIFCVGVNYHAHRLETGRPDVAHPTIFTRFATSLSSHGGPYVCPADSDQFDYEGELAVVIGRPGRHIAVDDALAHVAGFSCFNDGTARDWQAHTSQFTPGKNFTHSGPFGPWMVTPDDVPDLAACSLVTRVNGHERQRATIADMVFSIPEIIAYLSTFCELLPGDVIATGTPGGVGSRMDPPQFLAPGDVVEIEIDHVGLLRNVVTAE